MKYMVEPFQESEISGSVSASTAVWFCVGNLGLLFSGLTCAVTSGMLNIFHFPLFKMRVIILSLGLQVASMMGT